MPLESTETKLMHERPMPSTNVGTSVTRMGVCGGGYTYLPVWALLNVYISVLSISRHPPLSLTCRAKLARAKKKSPSQTWTLAKHAEEVSAE